ncbi:MAG: hypothetical protein IPJ98_09460 [Bryobacterales bacterium]|nr:hypothetical protein [Bryobacterales bacterium]
MPVFDLLGGKVRDAVPCYDHVGGRDAAEASENVLKSQASGYRHIRVQFGGYGGGGFIPAGQEAPPPAATQARPSTKELYVDRSPRCSSRSAPRSASPPSSADVHSTSPA